MLPRKLFVGIAFILLGLPWSRAAEVTTAPQVIALSPTSIVIRWRTDVPTGTRVTYGLSAERMNQSAGGPLTDVHEVTLSGLQPGTKYFFAAGTARKQLVTGQFTTLSSPLAVRAPPSISPSSAPRPAKMPAPSTVAPPARQTWGTPGSLRDHYERHGGDFRAVSPDDYAAQAWHFRQRARSGALRVKVDDDGVQRVFDPATGAFAAYNRDGTTKTYFKPGSSGYFDRQPGRPVKAITP